MKTLKKLFALATLTLILSTQLSARVQFFLDHLRYQDINGDSYLEVYLSVNARTLSYEQMEDRNYQGEMDIVMILNRIEGVDTQSVFVENYKKRSALLADTSEKSLDQAYMDVKRFPVKPGRYELLTIVADGLKDDNPANKAIATVEILIDEEAEKKARFSDISFISEMERASEKGEWVKNGYRIIPFVTNATYIDEDKLQYYAEVYHADASFDQAFFVETQILKGKQILFIYDNVVKKNPAPINIVTGNFDISALPSNTYYLKMTMRNEKNQPVAQQLQKFFVYNSRVTPEFKGYVADGEGGDGAQYFSKYTEEELDELIPGLVHISTDQEYAFARRLESYEQKQNYLYNFWSKRKRTQEQSVAEVWTDYYKRLKYCNDEFDSALRPGSATDRGRVFLSYGVPNDVERFPYEDDRLPYEIWRYDRIDAQNKVVFIFYDNDLATNEYPLLHSNKYGELNNPSWRRQLLNGDTPGFQDDEPGSSMDLYDMPR